MTTTLSLSNHKLSVPTSKLEIVDDLIKERINQKESENAEWQSKRLGKRKEHLQALFLYPAMMVADAQRDLISIIKDCQPGIESLFDPFMGAASALIAGVECGLNCYGQDINPLAVLLAKVKLERCDLNQLLANHQQVVQTSKKLLGNYARIGDFAGIDKWFKPNVKDELGRLQTSIRAVTSVEVRRFLWVTLAETVRLTSNDRISTYKLHRRNEEEVQRRELSPIQVFDKLGKDNLRYLSGFCRMLEKKGYLSSKGKYNREVEIMLADTQSVIKAAKYKCQFDLLVSSPPYGDNKSTIPYGQHSFLPLQWIDMKDIVPNLDNTFLQSTHHIDTMSIGGRTRTIAQRDQDYLFEISPRLKWFIGELKQGHTHKVNKVLNFFLDIDKSFHHIAQSMAINSYSIWTIGNRNVGGIEVPNDLIMRDFLEAKEFTYITKIERTILNKKMPSKNNYSQTMKTEKILILRKSGE